MNITERIAQLLALQLSNQATPDQLQELQLLLQEHPQEQFYADIINQYWVNSNDEATPKNSYLEFAEQKANTLLDTAKNIEATSFETSTKISSIPRFVKQLLAVAACFIVMAIAYYAFIYKPVGNAIAVNNEVEVKKGTKTRILLPDGTTVQINSDSKLTYAKNFNTLTRDVFLQGEAFFDVAENKPKPFIVHTNGINIKVLGTVFNVKAYDNEPTIEATLLKGSIQVFDAAQTTTPLVTLKPYEKVTYNKLTSTVNGNSAKKENTAIAALPTATLAISTINKNIVDSTTIKEVSWVYNKLTIEGETFEEMIPKLERWFNVSIVIKNKTIANKKLRVVFENETIEQALKALQIITAFNYTINENAVIIDKIK